MDIVIYGAGSLGSLLGGLLARTPDHEVTLVGRDPHVSTVNEEGLHVTGEEEFTVHPAATTDGTGLSGDLAVVLVKAFDTEQAAHDLGTGEFDAVCSLQNGMGNEDILAGYLEWPVLAGTTGFGAVLDSPGEVSWNGGGDVVVGPWKPADASGVAQDVGEAFAAGGIPAAVEDADAIRRHLWRKLAVNAALNPSTALARVENGAFSVEPGADLVEPVVREVAATARATGVDLPNEDTVVAVEEIIEATAENESSMYRDIQRGRRTEIDVINGYIADIAADHDVAVPANRTLCSLVRAWEKGQGLR